MKYTVQGFTGKKYRNLVAFTQAFIDILKIGKCNRNLFILCDDAPDAQGRAIDTEHGEYLVFLSPKLKTSELIQTLAHEMVHIKQYAKGQLRVKNLGVSWRGKMYKYSEDRGYHTRPWEIEAMKREVLIHYQAQSLVSK